MRTVRGAFDRSGREKKSDPSQSNVVAARQREEARTTMELTTITREDGSKPPRARLRKQVILIRHGRSAWNEFLGAHKRQMWEEQERRRAGVRQQLKQVFWRPGGNNSGQSPSGAGAGPSLPGSASSGTVPLLPCGTPSEASYVSPATTSALGSTVSSSSLNLSGVASLAGSKEEERKGFWQGVRGGVKQVANALSHAGKLNQVDHQLSAGGVVEARTLRNSISTCAMSLGGEASPSSSSTAPAQAPGGDAVSSPSKSPANAFGEAAASGAGATSQQGVNGAESALLCCNLWLVSPYLRALQTAGYALAPLRARKAAAASSSSSSSSSPSDFRIRVTPQASEIVNSTLAQDCQGKRGNVGYKMISRAIAKLADIMEEEGEDLDGRITPQLTLQRQEELNAVCATLCSFDLSEVSQAWWPDVANFKKEQLRLEDMRVRKLVATILKAPEEVVGVVAHSLLFQRLIQLFWPHSTSLQQDLRDALRNGAGPETKDPLQDKMCNCGVLVLTFSYFAVDEAVTALSRSDAEIVEAKWLFGGRMESAVIPESQVEIPEVDAPLPMEDLNEFLSEVGTSNSASNVASPRGESAASAVPLAGSSTPPMATAVAASEVALVAGTSAETPAIITTAAVAAAVVQPPSSGEGGYPA